MANIASIEAQLPWLFRLFLASLCGALIGYERAIQRKSAGVRTHIVVAFSSALFMIVSKYGFYDVIKTSGIEFDASRVAAQIVSGISFIGAGTILIKKDQVSGLTTAAGIWATAAIGMSIGSGLYFLGILATALLFVIQMLFHDDTLINKIIMHIRFNIQIQAVNKPHILEKIEEELKANHVENVSVKILYVSDERIIFFADGIINNNLDENDIIMALRKYPDIERISYNSLGK